MCMHGNIFLTNEHMVKSLIDCRCLRASTVLINCLLRSVNGCRNECPVESSLRTDNHKTRELGTVSPRNSSQYLGEKPAKIIR